MNSSRNIYKNEVDFTTLAMQDPQFSEFLKPNGQLDFSDPAAVKQLTKSLLHRDFGLDIELPDDRLCPPVPNRLNYILWLQDLIDCTGDNYWESSEGKDDRDVVGLDIGTGASCIYPLLGVTERKSWRFVATDIDEKSLRYARENVSRNKLQSRIRIIEATQKGPLIPLEDKIPLESIEFTMCNPPFYESEDDLLISGKEKQRPPASACTGAVVEMVTEGGEVAFVTRMIEESLQLRKSVQWYTSMLGKLSSVSTLVEKLQEVGNKNWAITEFVQGNRTRRWAIAWSWKDIRPTMTVARGHISSIPKHFLPFPSEFTFHPPLESIDSVIQDIDTEIKSLHIPWRWESKISSGVGFTMGNVWSRQARRKRQQRLAEGGTESDNAEAAFDESQATFGFVVRVRQTDVQTIDVILRWVKGVDSVLFESFCGMLKRKVEKR